MQLAKIQLARSIWLFDTAELNPYGITVFPHFIFKIKDQYNFRQVPQFPTTPPSGNNSLRFDTGSFLVGGDSFDIGLEIFADGIMADSRASTAICDAFLTEFIKWMAGELKVAISPAIGKKRVYRSEIIFYADGPLAGVSPLVDGIAQSLGSQIGVATEMTAVSFGYEGKHSVFSIERLANAPFEDLKFFSWAFLQTDAHIRLINMFGNWAENTRKTMAEADRAATDARITGGQTEDNSA